MANPVHVLEIGRSVVRRRSRPLAGLPLAPVVSLKEHRNQTHLETVEERVQRLTEANVDIARHVLAIVQIIRGTSHV
jgi:hypothetical protein